MTNKIQQNEFVENIKALPKWDKVFYISNIALILGFLLPFLAVTGGMFIKLPYAWILFIVALSMPLIKIFMDESQLKNDLLFGFSEAFVVICLFGLIIIGKLSNLMAGFTYDSISAFDIIGVGAVFLILGSIALFISVIFGRK